jgi:putative nucleotidyltransferase with HDIG domain
MPKNRDVPLRPRPTPGGHALPMTGSDARPITCVTATADSLAVSAADRNMLHGMAEDSRGQAGLEYVAIFRHAAGSHSVLEELAQASTVDAEETAGVRAAGHAAVRGMRRFARRAVTLTGGVYVVAAEATSGEVASVIASGGPDARLPAGVNAALVELAQVAARVLCDPATPAGIALRPPIAVPPTIVYGTRVADALAFLQHPPILAETRARLARAVEQRHAALGDAIEAVETDVGLAMAVLSAANQLPGTGVDGVASVTSAISALGPRGTLRLAATLPTLRAAAPADRLTTALARISAHAIATRSAVEYLARSLGETGRDELRLAATLHDVGKVALVALREDYLDELSKHSTTPEDRLAAEQLLLPVDHATLGGHVIRRLGVPPSLATLVAHHHAEDADGRVAIIRLADMLAHVASGDPVGADALASVGTRLSLEEETLEAIAYDLQRARGATMAIGPSPLTHMQEKALRGLAEGKRYKEIAVDLGLADSTVRSHMHNLYRKLGVADRARAVLLASERGWI